MVVGLFCFVLWHLHFCRAPPFKKWLCERSLFHPWQFGHTENSILENIFPKDFGGLLLICQQIRVAAKRSDTSLSHTYFCVMHSVSLPPPTPKDFRIFASSLELWPWHGLFFIYCAGPVTSPFYLKRKSFSLGNVLWLCLWWFPPTNLLCSPFLQLLLVRFRPCRLSESIIFFFFLSFLSFLPCFYFCCSPFWNTFPDFCMGVIS